MPVTGVAPTVAGTSGCPKRMIFGPCGGVRADGRCEMRDQPCVFPELVPWPGDESTGRHPATVTQAQDGGPQHRVPLVLTDLSVPPFEAAALAEVTAVLAPSCDAVLVGEHQNRPDFPPTLLAARILDAGAHPWITLTCRDRNRIVLEQDLRGLRDVGVDTVLCVTGDGRGYDVRPDVTQVFDLDGTRLAALTAMLGLRAAVPETPAAPPRHVRPARLAQKQRAGASVAVLNHAGGAAQVAAFVAAARAAGATLPVLASVAVYTDDVSAAVLQGLPGLDLDPATVARVLGAADPVAAGISAAVAEAEALLRVPGIAGVNLSGRASGRGYRFAAEVKAEIGVRIREAASA
ncbi:MAG: methylenetetrahydrofolate reductase C-terminal domain-containing protein [bacterium]